MVKNQKEGLRNTSRL